MSADTTQVAKEWLRYEQDGGIYWIKTASSKAVSGSEAGWLDKDGYIVITLKGVKHRAARLVWMMHVGEIPIGFHVDHINRNIKDNRIENLRLASPSQNSCNRDIQTNNFSGAKGCTLHHGKYQAQIQVNGRYKYLGRFVKLSDARDAYNNAAKHMHKEFMNASR